MKTSKTLVAAAAALTIGTQAAFAGNMAEPIMDDTVVLEEAAASSDGGILVPLLFLILLAAAIGGGSGNSIPLDT